MDAKTLTLEDIEAFNQEAERSLMVMPYIPVASPLTFLLRRANLDRALKVVNEDCLEYLEDVGLGFPKGKCKGNNVGLAPFFRLFLWETLRNFPDLSIDNIGTILTFEWSRMKGLFYDVGESVPQGFLKTYRDQSQWAMYHFFPEESKEMVVEYKGCPNKERMNERGRVDGYVYKDSPFVDEETNEVMEERLTEGQLAIHQQLENQHTYDKIELTPQARALLRRKAEGEFSTFTDLGRQNVNQGI